MISSYKRKISKNEKRWIIASLVLGIIICIATFYTKLSYFWIIYVLCYSVIHYLNIKKPIAKITEKNRLVIGTFYIDIFQIISLGENKKKNLQVRYLFNDMERSTSIPVSDEDKPQLIEDLLKINANIVVNYDLDCFLPRNNVDVQHLTTNH